MYTQAVTSATGSVLARPLLRRLVSVAAALWPKVRDLKGSRFHSTALNEAFPSHHGVGARRVDDRDT
jgi:hypothetical protein